MTELILSVVVEVRRSRLGRRAGRSRVRLVVDINDGARRLGDLVGAIVGAYYELAARFDLVSTQSNEQVGVECGGRIEGVRQHVVPCLGWRIFDSRVPQHRRRALHGFIIRQTARIEIFERVEIDIALGSPRKESIVRHTRSPRRWRPSAPVGYGHFYRLSSHQLGVDFVADEQRRSADTERELVTLAQGGNERAFAELISPYQSLMYGVCFRVTGSEHDALDAVQDAMLAAWRFLGRFEHRSRFSTWLYRIAHNAALASAQKKVPQPVDVDAMPSPPARSSPDAEVADSEALQWALARIPPEFRAALVLREYAGFGTEEIAEIQGVEVTTVRTRIARARKALAALLTEAGAT